MIIPTIVLNYKIPFYNLSGLAEIWVTQQTVNKSKDNLLRYLRKKLKDESITTISIINGEYYIIRCPQRIEILKNPELEWNPIDYPILGDDKYFIMELVMRDIDTYHKYKYFNALSPRLKIEGELLGFIAIMTLEEYGDPEIDCMPPFPNIDIVINTLQCRDCRDNNRCLIYLKIPEIYKHNSLIIDIVLTLPCDNIDDLEDVIDSMPNNVKTYDFIINNLSNQAITRIYPYLDENLLCIPELMTIAAKYDHDDMLPVWIIIEYNNLNTVENLVLILNHCVLKDLCDLRNHDIYEISKLFKLEINDPDIKDLLLECKKQICRKSRGKFKWFDINNPFIWEALVECMKRT